MITKSKLDFLKEQLNGMPCQPLIKWISKKFNKKETMAKFLIDRLKKWSKPQDKNIEIVEYILNELEYYNINNKQND